MNQGLNDPTKNVQNDLRGVLGSTASGAGLGFMVGGPMGASIGAAAGLLVDALPKIIGTGGSVDQNTGEIQYASGLGKIFGRDDAALRRESNRIKNVNLSRVQTENLKTNYYNNSNVPTSVNILAAEGGVMRQPVDALVSKGELIYDPETKQLSKVPGSKGKPNKKDDVAVKLHEGDIVVSNSPTMLMANGKTPAQNLENMVTIDKKKNNKLSEGTIKAREAVIKKVVNWQEANKTKPQEYAKFGDGTGKKGVPDLSDMFLYRQKDGKFVMQDINGNRYDVPEMMLPYIQGDERGYYFGPQTGVAPSAGKWNGSMNFAKQMVNSKNIAKLKNSATKVFGRSTKPANISGPTKPVKGTSPDVLGKPKTAQEAAQMARNERTANMWQQLTSKGGAPQKTLEGPQTWSTARGSSNLWENPMALQSGDDIAQAINKAYYLNKGLPTAAVVATMLGGAGTFLTHKALKDKPAVSPAKTNSSTVAPVETPQTTESVSTSTPADKKVVKHSNKKVTNTTTTSTPAVKVNSAIKNSILPEYDRLSFAEPFQFNNQHLRYAPGNYVPIKPLDIEVEDEVVDEIGLPKDKSKSKINWDDLAYKAAVLSQPLWDRAKAGPVKYEIADANYIPVGVNIDPTLNAIDQSAAISRYNLANINTNTGANLALASKLATDRAKRYADAYAYQQNAQNELIGKNVGIYNQWA